MCGHTILQLLQKCKQNLISFSFAADMNEITNDMSNYAIGQRTLVSVWTHEQPETGKKRTGCLKFSITNSTKKLPKTDTSAMRI